MIFNIYHVFAPFVKLSGCRFLYFFSLSDVRNKVVFLLLEHSSLRGLNRKNTQKTIKFWPLNPYYKRSDWKTELAERFSEVLTSKLWNKKNIHTAKAYWNRAKLNYIHPLWLNKNIWQIHSRNSHIAFTEKNKVGNTMLAKLLDLIGQKRQNSFQETHAENFFLNIR